MTRLRALLVDDEDELIFTLVERLELRDIQAVGATNGEEALRLLAESRFDVVVVDVRMPGMNGVQLARLIRHKHPQVAVVLITGHGSMGDAAACREFGASEVLAKPVDLQDLVLAMQRAVEERS